MKKTLPLVVGMFLAIHIQDSRAADIPIVIEGKPKAIIVLGEAEKRNAKSATILFTHVKQMTGAALPFIAESELSEARLEDGRIVAPAGKTTAETFVLLGESALTKKLGLSLDGIGVGGIVVKTTGNALILMGRIEEPDGSRSDANASAVIHFLETLGCRHLWPSPSGQVIPQKPSIVAANLDVRYTPKVGQRVIRMMPRGQDRAGSFIKGLAWLGYKDEEYTAGMAKSLQNDSLGAWGMWNGLGGRIGIRGGHAGSGLRGGWEEHGKTHPEWFALQPDGTRDQSKAGNRWRICEGNLELRAHVANDILKQLNGKAQSPISLSPNDGGYSSFCMAPESKALDAPNAPKIHLRLFAKVGEGKSTEVEYPSLTDRHVHYWNDIATRVTKVVPDQLFIVDAYSVYSDAPVRERLHPNLIVRYVPSEAKAWKGWKEAGAQRIYWRPNNLHGGYVYGVVSPRARTIAEHIRTFANDGMLATDMQGIYNFWSTQGLDYYVAARVTWNPSLTFDTVLDDYCTSGFGTGAEHIKKYWRLADSGIEIRKIGRRGQFPLIAPETLEAMRAALIAASKATASEVGAHQRVDFLRAGFEFTAISAEAHRLKEAAESGTKLDSATVTAVMERRWQIMRAILKSHPLAVNVALVAANDAPLNAALGWKGPSALAREGRLTLPMDDDWLNSDQSEKRGGASK